MGIRTNKRIKKKGINASMDVFETQLQTVNLNTMMVSKIKNSGYIVIVLTENYANKLQPIITGTMVFKSLTK